MENRNASSPTLTVRDALLTGVLLGMIIMAMVSWLIGAALVGTMTPGDWIISAPDALRWMLIIWILGCGEGFYGGWWYHYRMPVAPGKHRYKKATREAATSMSGRSMNSPLFYIGQRRKSRRNRDARNDHRRVRVY